MQINKVRYRSLLLLFVFIRIAVIIEPAVALRMPSVITIVSLFGMYAIIISNLAGSSFIKIVGKYLPVASMVFLVLCFGLVRGGGEIFNTLYKLPQILIWPCLLAIIYKKQDIKFARIVLYFTLLCYAITAATTYYGCIQIPQVSRMLAAGVLFSEEEVTYFRSLNIGGFDFVYNMVLMIPLLVYMFRCKRLNGLFVLPIIVLFILTIIATEFTTALLFSFVGLSLLLVKPNSSIKSVLWLVFLAGVSYMILKEFLVANKDFIVNLFSSESIQVRIDTLISMIGGDNNADTTDADARIFAYTKSLTNFIHSPLWGTGERGGFHSYIFDEMSDTGIIGILAMTTVYISMYRCFIKPFRKTAIYKYIFCIFVINLLLGFLNPTNSIQILTFITPLVCLSYEKAEKYV